MPSPWHQEGLGIYDLEFGWLRQFVPTERFKRLESFVEVVADKKVTLADAPGAFRTFMNLQDDERVPFLENLLYLYQPQLDARNSLAGRDSPTFLNLVSAYDVAQCPRPADRQPIYELNKPGPTAETWKWRARTVASASRFIDREPYAEPDTPYVGVQTKFVVGLIVRNALLESAGSRV